MSTATTISVAPAVYAEKSEVDSDSGVAVKVGLRQRQWAQHSTTKNNNNMPLLQQQYCTCLHLSLMISAHEYTQLPSGVWKLFTTAASLDRNDKTLYAI